MLRKIFTLIEMLVVIAIIGILASLLQPSLRKALDLANTTSCLGNVKQHAVAVSLYINDYNNYLPVASLMYPNARSYWKLQLGPYLGLPLASSQSNLETALGQFYSTGLFHCPSSHTDELASNYSTVPGRYGGYGWNYARGGTGGHMLHPYGITDNIDDYGPVRINDIEKPSQTFTTGDVTEQSGLGDTNYSQIINPVNGSTLYNASTVHGEGANYSFADGHGGAMSQMQIAYDYPDMRYYYKRKK